jgi:3-methyladenine DNA glycosylase AlkD
VTIDVDDAKELLCDGAHEERLTALLILVNKFQRTDEAQRRAIVDLYLASTEHVNNWDLVDSSAAHLLPAVRRLLP